MGCNFWKVDAENVKAGDAARLADAMVNMLSYVCCVERCWLSRLNPALLFFFFIVMGIVL